MRCGRLTIDLVKVLRNSKEPSGKIVGGLDHSILGLSPEHRQCSLFRKVVEQAPVLLSSSDTKLKVLRSSKGREELSSELVSPLVEELELSPRREAILGCDIMKLIGKLGWVSARGGVSRTVSVKQVDLGDLACIGGKWGCLFQAVKTGRDRVPRSKITPVLVHVQIDLVLGLVDDEGVVGSRPVVGRVRCGSLDSSRFDTGECDAWVTDPCLEGK